MSDTVIKVPGPVSMTKDRNTVQQFKEIVSRSIPESCEEVDSYDTVQLVAVPNGLEGKKDFITGKMRNPRWGVHLSLSVTPELDKVNPGPIMAPVSQVQFFAADSVEELRDRLIFEVTQVLDMAKLACKDPEGYQDFQRQAMQEHFAKQKSENG